MNGQTTEEELFPENESSAFLKHLSQKISKVCSGLRNQNVLQPNFSSY